MEKTKKPFYKRWWFIALVVMLILGSIFGGENNEDDKAKDITSESKENKVEQEKPEEKPEEDRTLAELKQTVDKLEEWSIDETPSQKEVEAKLKEIDPTLNENEFNSIMNGMNEGIDYDTQAYLRLSEDVKNDVKKEDAIKLLETYGFTKGNIEYAKTELEIKEEPQAKVSKEFENALKKAESYADIMSMSKKGIYEQLTSEYGEGFPAEAAQYAIDNIEWDFKENAYIKAKNYQEIMSMSINNIKEQLISEYGEQFTEEEAQYAVDKLSKE